MNNEKNPKRVEKAINSLFEKYDIQKKISVVDLKSWIWNATGGAMEASTKFHKKCLNLFPPADDIDEMNEIVQIFVDAWNYFPHKELDGKSPNQMYKEIYGEKTDALHGKIQDKKDSPKVRVGDHEMEWDEFEKMIKEMEEVQKPFKKWIKKEALPKYRKYLEQIVKNKKKCEDHYGVADIFFQRVLHIGFVELKDIRRDFIRIEFPRWWPTHVMYSDLRPVEVKKSLKLLFEFIELVYKFNFRLGF